MNKFVVVLPIKTSKKHSVRYDSKDKEALVTTIYISNNAFQDEAPKAVKITIEEA